MTTRTPSAATNPREISTPDSSLHVWVIPTNEELMIALDVKALLG